MRLRTHTATVLIISALFCVAAAAVYGISVYLLEQYNTRLAEERERIAATRTAERERMELTRAADDIEATRTELRRYFVDPDSIVGFLESIETLGRTQGAVVSTASLDAAEGRGRVNELRLSVKASGTLASVQRVLAQLEQLPYRSNVTDVRIERTSEEHAAWEGTFALTVAQYKN